MSKMDEIIIVVPRKALFENENFAFQGTESRPDVVARLANNIQNNFGIMRRGDAEENERFKQPIPYAVIRKGTQLFMYERLEGGGEVRMHGLLSLGAGGHMNAVEGVRDFVEVTRINLERELEEELNISHSFTPKTLGFINDESTDFSRVHIGMLSIIDLPDDATVEVRETDQLEGDFVELSTLKSKAIYDRLEDWSKIVVDTLTK
jgi:predicted NUDIX family phosphoesterase